MAIYLEIEGIKGDVTSTGFEDQIALESMSFGVSREVSMEAGSVRNREQGLPYMQTIICSKQMDSSTPLLLQKVLTGANSEKTVLRIVRTGDSGGVVKVGEITLEEAMISDYSFSSNAGSRPMETLSISFTKIEFDFSGADSSGKNGNNIMVIYDLAAARVE
ncbi:type VI secretion system tube protein Hcp [Marinobacter sp. chi1]|uniref:Type VI secretion system tube protein Hcp n=1 Tax=Marinobacter suaedae TaxID=3057675 RepID=A0ABT8VW26_9GAMM|nr:type VI secretion system tube protein Hcp [Marinobacter sp. chi1]MDO3720192.1 type VI secretion system tube protein Hcp [Marinobacter sp. chi1]